MTRKKTPAEPPRLVTETCTRCKGKGKWVRPNGVWLRWKRQQAGVTLREMGRRLGYTQAHLSLFELGDVDAPMSVLAEYDKLVQKPPG